MWPGYRTEFLQLPQAELTVVVISNNSLANPYRLAREIALAALDDGRRMPASTNTSAETAGLVPVAIEALVGTWLNTELPALFTLSTQQGELQASQWGVTFPLAEQANGSYLPWRGAYEFRLHALSADAVDVDVGANQRAPFQRLGIGASLPPDLVGSYRSDDLDVVWHVQAASTPPAPSTPGEPAALQITVEGPIVRSQTAWPVRALAPDLFEISAPGYGLTSTMLARVQRDAAGAVVGLEVFSGRIRKLRFTRVADAPKVQTTHVQR